jgi:hypothetical protein
MLMRVNGRKVTVAFLAVLAATLLLASLSLGAAQSTNWTLTVTAASGSYTSTCTFGVNSGASSVSSGFDQTYDQVVPPPPPTGVYSYLYFPDFSSSPVDLQDLSTSIIAPTDSWTWTYCVENIGATGTVVVSWTSGNIVTTSMTLQPTGAASVNMLTTSQYSFTATQGQTYTFTITAQNSSSPTPTTTSPPRGGSTGGGAPTPTPLYSSAPSSPSPTPSPGLPGLPSFSFLPSLSYATVKIIIAAVAVVAVIAVISLLIKKK